MSNDSAIIEHDLVQGSDEWLAHRRRYLNASETAAMLGISPHQTRGQLLREKATGIVAEVDAGTQRRFDDGHVYEAQARPWAETEVMDELLPKSLSRDVGGLSLAASMDGITANHEIAWEHKTLNADIGAAHNRNEIPEYIRVQMEHQLIVSGARRCLFMASNGNPKTAVKRWYKHDPVLAQRVLDGWKQFQKDLEAYEHTEAEPEAVGRSMESLPALNIQVEAKVLATNIDAYKAHAIAVFESINTDLQTDQDFADAEKAVKFCKEVEDRLTAAKDHALQQAEDLYAALSSIDDVSESARQKRLALDKLVKARKEARRIEIQDQAVQGLRDHINAINDSLPQQMQLGAPATFRADVGAAMKGKRTIQSLMDSADQALTDAKLAANAEADQIRSNLKQFDELAGDYKHLFADLRNLVGKPADDFANTVKLRISEYLTQQEAKRQAEQKMAEIEAKRKEQEARDRAEASKKADEAPQQPVSEVSAPTSTDAALKGEATATNYLSVLKHYLSWRSGKECEPNQNDFLDALKWAVAKIEGYREVGDE